MTREETYTGCVFAFMFGEWAVLMEKSSGDGPAWVLPSVQCNPPEDVRYRMQELMADRFGMCVLSSDFRISKAVQTCMTAYIDPTGGEAGPEVIFDELCKAELRWLPVVKLHRFTDDTVAEFVSDELVRQGIWRNLYHIFKSKLRKPIL